MRPSSISTIIQRSSSALSRHDELAVLCRRAARGAPRRRSSRRPRSFRSRGPRSRRRRAARRAKPLPRAEPHRGLGIVEESPRTPAGSLSAGTRIASRIWSLASGAIASRAKPWIRVIAYSSPDSTRRASVAIAARRAAACLRPRTLRARAAGGGGCRARPACRLPPGGAPGASSTGARARRGNRRDARGRDRRAEMKMCLGTVKDLWSLRSSARHQASTAW